MVSKEPLMTIGVLLVMLLLTMPACQRQTTEEREVEDNMRSRGIEQVMNDHSAELMAIEGVTGVAIGKNDDGIPCIMILVIELDEQIKDRLPDSIEGHPVCLFASGEIHPMNDEDN